MLSPTYTFWTSLPVSGCGVGGGGGGGGGMVWEEGEGKEEVDVQ